MRSSTRHLAGVACACCVTLTALLGGAVARAQEPAAETAETPAPAADQPAEQPAEPADAKPAAVDPAASSGERHGPTDPTELEAFVDGIMATHLKDKHIAGATIAFVVDNKPFFAKGYGYADVAAHKQVDPESTMFRVGSVSKLFTWTAVMRLVEEGKLDLDADINKYLAGSDFQIPETYPEPITLRHLLSHTPGFEDHVIGLFGRSTDDLEPLGQLLAHNLPARVRKPGLLASYSNHGTAVAGYIVQLVSGKPWEEYIEETILVPLGMTHTTIRQPAEDKLPPEMSKGYAYADGHFVEKGFEYVPPAPAGSMSASAGDIVKFMIAHLQNGEYHGARILNEDTARQMHSLLFTHDPRIEGMAYGFMRMKYGDEEIVEHGGDTFLFHSFFVMLPQRNSGFFVSYNTTTAGSARNTLLTALMDRYYPPANPLPIKPTSDFAKRAALYPGNYGAIRHSYTTAAKLGAMFSVARVSVDDDNLVLSIGDDFVMRFVEIEPELFREVEGERMVAFHEDPSGQVTQMFLSGSPVAWLRLPWYETPEASLVLIGSCVAILLSAVIGWPLAAFINRGHAQTAQRTAGSRFATWFAWLTSLAILVVLGLGMIPFSDPEEIGYGMPPLLSGLLLASPVLAALVAGVFVCSLVAWARGYWRLSARLHYTCVLVAGLMFVWFLNHWNLMGLSASAPRGAARRALIDYNVRGESQSFHFGRPHDGHLRQHDQVHRKRSRRDQGHRQTVGGVCQDGRQNEGHDLKRLLDARVVRRPDHLRSARRQSGHRGHAQPGGTRQCAHQHQSRVRRIRDRKNRRHALTVDDGLLKCSMDCPGWRGSGRSARQRGDQPQIQLPLGAPSRARRTESPAETARTAKRPRPPAVWVGASGPGGSWPCGPVPNLRRISTPGSARRRPARPRSSRPARELHRASCAPESGGRTTRRRTFRAAAFRAPRPASLRAV